MKRITLALMVCCLTTLSPQSVAMTVIVNSSVPQEKLNVINLRTIFSGRQRYWEDGSNIKVVILGFQNTSHLLFCNQVLDVFPHQIRRSWERSIFSGLSRGPIIVNDFNEMKKIVAQTPGAVGYIDTYNDEEGVHEILLH